MLSKHYHKFSKKTVFKRYFRYFKRTLNLNENVDKNPNSTRISNLKYFFEDQNIYFDTKSFRYFLSKNIILSLFIPD